MRRTAEKVVASFWRRSSRSFSEVKSMRRGVANLLLAGAVVILAGPRAGAAPADRTRRPRFLFAAAESPAPVRVDVKSVPALRRNLSFQLRYAILSEALAEISLQAGLNLVYAADVIPGDTRVTLRADEITV